MTVIYHGQNFPGTGGIGGGGPGTESQLYLDAPGWYLLGDDRTHKVSPGLHSVDFSFADFGSGWGAYGQYSFCAGAETRAGDYAVSFGYQNSSAGDYSFASGFGNSANGSACSAFGDNNVVAGQSSFAAGGSCIVSASLGAAFGEATEVARRAGFAAGKYVKVSTAAPDGAFALGVYNEQMKANQIEGVGIGDGQTPGKITLDGRRLWMDGTEELPESTVAKITARGKKAVTTVEYVDQFVARTALQGAPALLGCGSSAGFTNRWLAEKVQAGRDAQIVSLGVGVYNSYGSRQVQLALYSSTGTLLGSTTLATIVAGRHGYVQLPLSVAVNVTDGAEFWVCVYGNGIDLFNTATPAALNSTLSGSHAIEQTSGTTGVPAALTLVSPQALATVTVPMWGA